MDQRRILLVLRHAQTEDTRPGSRDSERRLTPAGERDAQQVGDYLRGQGMLVDTVLCSSAVRARQTFELLKVGDQLEANRVEIADRFYNAGGDTLINAVRELPQTATSPCWSDMRRVHRAWSTN
jgi:phosphohistidine phosphatase